MPNSSFKIFQPAWLPCRRKGRRRVGWTKVEALAITLARGRPPGEQIKIRVASGRRFHAWRHFNILTSSLDLFWKIYGRWWWFINQETCAFKDVHPNHIRLRVAGTARVVPSVRWYNPGDEKDQELWFFFFRLNISPQNAQIATNSWFHFLFVSLFHCLSLFTFVYLGWIKWNMWWQKWFSTWKDSSSSANSLMSLAMQFKIWIFLFDWD